MPTTDAEADRRLSRQQRHARQRADHAARSSSTTRSASSSSELAKQGLDSSTLIIVSAKHGQSPIDVEGPRGDQSDAPFQSTPGFGTHGFEICDDEGLIWLQPDLQQANYAAAEAYLKAQCRARCTSRSCSTAPR